MGVFSCFGRLLDSTAGPSEGSFFFFYRSDEVVQKVGVGEVRGRGKEVTKGVERRGEGETGWG